jgi:hypothetical protein
MPFGRTFWWQNMVLMFVIRFIGWVVHYIMMPLHGGKMFVQLMLGRKEVGLGKMLVGKLVTVCRLGFGMMLG